MRYRNGSRNLLSGTLLVVLVCSAVLGGCDNTGENDVTVNGTLDVTATNTAAIGGITFTFSDGAIFGFPGQSTTLAWGSDGTTFTLTSGGTVIQGTITFGSCIFTQNPAPSGAAPFVRRYDTCRVSGSSDEDIGVGSSGNGKIALTLGLADTTPVDSAPVPVGFAIDASGNITINMNTTPIGVVG